ncbi:MAG: FAD-dependent oxidoreductase [Coriobacteriia bacterium]|nr:FAD-dependent oxidoreductase [Coriobacteriia bacterium]
MAHNLVVIGAGPGGVAAALEARRHGAQVTLIERDPLAGLGGTCLNRGCIPTKTILRTARALREMRDAHELGIQIGAPTLDLAVLRARVDEVVTTLRTQIATELKRAKVEVVFGEARINADGTVTVESLTLKPDSLIIATGSVPLELPHIDHRLERVWTSNEALELREIPQKLLIVGGGVIGVEFASMYAAFGSQVTIVELGAQILPGMDRRVARTLAAALIADGIEIRTNTSVEAVRQEGERIRATLSDGTELYADVLLSAVGRRPIAPDAALLEALPIPAVVIGDAAEGVMLAHAAEHEGEHTGRRLSVPSQSPSTRLSQTPIPACIYTHPEIATVGLTLDEAKRDGTDVVSAITKFTGNGRALAENDTDGFVQLIALKDDGRIVGAQIVGPQAVELIAQITLAMRLNATVTDLVDTVVAHPTLSETIRDAAQLLAAKLRVR